MAQRNGVRSRGSGSDHERLNPVALDLFKLDGRLALITGSSAGIGLALAEGMAAAGRPA
jgi:hypothetical protein